MDIRLEDVSYVYKERIAHPLLALDRVSLQIKKGEFLGIIGREASGKSTLIQHFNGLLRPTFGNVFINGLPLYEGAKEKVNLRWLRQKVGLVFQFPENGLFESSVIKDVEFGLKKLGFSGSEVRSKANFALEMMGLNPSEVSHRSPWSLSGGEMRRVAIASVLALEPEVLILDEPTAGLDPKGQAFLAFQLIALHQSRGITVVLVSHNLALVMRVCHRVILMRNGSIIADLSPKDLLRREDLLDRSGLQLPDLPQLMRRLQGLGAGVRADVLTAQEAKDEILRWLGSRG